MASGKQEQHINVCGSVEHFSITTVYNNITELTDHTDVSNSDLLVALTTSILEQSEQHEQPLSCLEQQVCQKLREVTGRDIVHFIDFYKFSFRKFLKGNNSNFRVKEEGNCKIVYKVEKEKGPSHHDTEREDERQCASSTAQDRSFDDPSEVQLTKCKPETPNSGHLQMQHDKDELDEKDATRPKDTCRGSIARDVAAGQMTSSDEAFVQHLLNQPEDNLHIFKRSPEDYKGNREQFTIDVVSMWNTPRRQRAYIVLGVKPRTSVPHALVGLRSTTDPNLYNSLFLSNLFQRKPKFTYREITCHGKLVGIIEISENYGEGFPSVVTSDDRNHYLRTNQVWVREQGKSVVLPPTDLLYSQVYICFATSTEPKIETVKQSRSDGKSLIETKPRDRTTDQIFTAPPANIAGQGVAGDIGKLMASLKNFNKGHFVLVCGSMNIACKNVDALSAVPWIAVYDFDVYGRDSGLLNRMEDGIKKRRNLTVSTWSDYPTGITEKGTQWWSLRGRREIPESLTPEESHTMWYKHVLDRINKLCICLARFSEDYTILNVLVLWPSSEFEARCLCKFLSKLQEYTQPKLLVCSSEPDGHFADSHKMKTLMEDFGDLIEIFNVSLRELCSEVERLLTTDENQAHFEYQLPSEDGKEEMITDRDAAWLTQDLEVLYLKSPYAKRTLTAEDLRKEAEEFFRGGTLNWHTLYDIGSGFLDVERAKSNEIVKHIHDNHIREYKPGRITVFHAPGAGGSTMAKRIVWELHEKAPCVQVKLRSGSSMEDLASRLNFLHEKTLLPVIALIDGEDEPRIKQLSLHLNNSHVIILYVKRYPYRIDESCLKQNSFYLKGEVTEQESRNLVLRYTPHCDKNKGKQRKLSKLDEEVRENKRHYMFEYGMTVYNHEFKGIQSFVRGYLWDDDRRKDLDLWQKYLGFLALVYYYGQSSMPCQFFSCLLAGRSATQTLDVEDLPHPMTEFIVPETNEGRGHFIRICHYVVAKEILEQILCRGDRHEPGSNSHLSKKAKRNLKAFCIDFISQAAKRKQSTSITAQTMTSILTRTFIFRDNRDISDIEERERKKKPQFSQIMSDMDQDPPYNGRLQVLEALCNMFPDDPNFKAHLARFYVCCRPEEEKKAEDLFKEALKLCEERRNNDLIHDKVRGREHRDDDEGLALTLMHIYHMYGTLFRRRIAKYTGRNLEDGLDRPKSASQFQKRLDEIVQNAEHACNNFMLCREHTPRGHEDCYQYINEINVRLQTCEFVRKFYAGGMAAYLSERNSGRNFDFIKESVTEIEDLIMECYNNVLLDIDDSSLRKAVLWYADLFQGCTEQLRALVADDTLASRRLQLIAKKLEFPRKNNLVCVDVPHVPVEKIKSLVEMLESIFDCEKTYDNPRRSILEVDYRDWLLAIRNPSFPKVYKLEDVVVRVRHWYNSVRSPHSTFYLFILLSLLGFGTAEKKGNNESLVEAQMLLEDMRKLTKLVVRPRCPREWLGRDDLEGIRRLVSNNSVGHMDNRRITNGAARAKLAVCKGTIRPRNKKVAGEISLDLGENSTPIHVFYVPVLHELEGSRYAGERVQFHLAFTLENGYEAYEVKLLDRYSCDACSAKVEMTQEQEELTCHCGSTVTKHEHALVARQ